MGRAAGLVTCGVATAAADRARLREAGADHVVTNLLELAALACGSATSLPPGP
jgi:phosphoglycolate phosphatase-like HAD superfamily hydrolase